jgi:catechol 1,2-dioxygenase
MSILIMLCKAGKAAYTSLTTQIFDKNSKYLIDDSVFAVKDDLVVDFRPLEGNSKAKLELKYDIKISGIKN